MDNRIAFEDTAERALAIKFRHAIWGRYGGENAPVAIEDLVAARAWLLIETLAREPSEGRQRIVAHFADEVLRRLNELEAPLVELEAPLVCEPL
jgi:hypothetical protein